MPKKENPLRQLPLNSNDYGEIKIHLAEIIEKKRNFFKPAFISRRNAKISIAQLPR